MISKHHYALTLAEANKVFFISAPGFGIRYTMTKLRKGLELVGLDYNLWLPTFFKFHTKPLYQYFVRRKLRRIFKVRVPEIDVCIDFGCYQQFDNLKWVDAKIKIYFPVDDSESLRLSNRGAYLLLSVSPNICKKFEAKGLKCHFINHGLASVFARAAVTSLSTPVVWKRRQKIKAAYSGNLFIPFLDRGVFTKLIHANPDVEFNFYGNAVYLGKDVEQQAWSKFLHNEKNVRLNGLLNPEALAEAYKDIDVFVLCYKPDYQNYHGENSHKIYEYLSTGKLMVSTYISIYEGSEMFLMAPKDRNEELVLIFSEAIKSLDKWNSPELSLSRIKISLDNSYSKQVERIGALIEFET